MHPYISATSHVFLKESLRLAVFVSLLLNACIVNKVLGLPSTINQIFLL